MPPPALPKGVAEVRGGGVTTPQGFVAAGVSCGIKTAKGALDLGILASERPAAAAAVFTRNRVKAYAVLVSSLHVRNGSARAVIVNSGCSNVATGPQGLRDANEMAELAAGALGVPTAEVLVGSTGVIGRGLPMAKIRAGVARLRPGRAGGHDFARANMTTDTYAKEVAVRINDGARTYAIGACAKGSGMIHPDMSTMFCWITTDAPVVRDFLRDALRAAVDDSLNMISIDGDTRTSDTVAIFANGAAGGEPIARGTPAAARFEAALRWVCTTMARMLARDGEGAQKLIEVRVQGAATLIDARNCARTITASPLVKSAVHGNDPNWGRLLMAAGRSGARILVDRARVWLGDTEVFRGSPRSFDARAASRYLRGKEIVLRVDLGVGPFEATAWGCDLTPEYVHINSDYTT